MSSSGEWGKMKNEDLGMWCNIPQPPAATQVSYRNKTIVMKYNTITQNLYLFY